MSLDITVAVPLYNKQDEIERCLRSVFHQTHRDFEIIVIDDGSTDASAARVGAFSDPRLKLISQKNGGLASARNRAIAEARAEIVAFLDADDEWLPGHLAQILALARTDAGMFCTAFWLDRGQGMRRRVRLSEKYIGAGDLLRDYFCMPNGKTLPSATAVRKKTIAAVGGFRHMFGEDIDLFLRIAACCSIAYGREATAIWHLDAQNRMCIAQNAAPKLYRPGSLQPSLNFIEATAAIPADVKAKARRYVAARERKAIIDTALQGQRDHAQLLLESWKKEYRLQDAGLEKVIRAPRDVLKLWSSIRQTRGRLLSTLAYVRDWTANRKVFNTQS